MKIFKKLVFLSAILGSLYGLYKLKILPKIISKTYDLVMDLLYMGKKFKRVERTFTEKRQ